MTGSGALAAGWMLVACTVLGAVAGALLGDAADLRVAGGLLGGLVGTGLGFLLVWKRYVVPANEEDARRDYSNVRPIEDDDDDNW